MSAHRPPPSDETLRSYLLGQLPPDELERVGRHLEENPDAVSTLSARQCSDTLLDALRAAPKTPTADSPELAALITQLSALSSSEAGQATIVAPAATPLADLGDLLGPAEAPDEIGRVAEYRVRRVLGRGGMGVVFEAEDPKLGRMVAIKVMLPKLATNETATRRFVLEAQTAATVEHDHIVPIYQIGEFRGSPYLTMPLLVGEGLDALLKVRSPLSPAEVALFGRQMADGLAAAHAAGLIHRDVKPSNIWLERHPDGSFKRVRILDFGLAKGRAESGDALTLSGAILGTPAYMSPEQARGDKLDHRADVFSLGCVLYEMATGRRPFAGPDSFAILTALATEIPPAPALVNPAVPPALSDLIARMLAKDPANRPQSARDVAAELERIARPGEPAGDRLPPHRRRNVWIAAGVLIAALAALGSMEGKTVVRVLNNQGELVVEVEDPGVEVVVKGEAVEIRREENGRRMTYLVKAGQDGEVEVRQAGTDIVLAMETFKVSRAGKVEVRVTNERLARKRESSASEPVLPAGETPPARDAFHGSLVHYDTFDNAKRTEPFQGEREGLTHAVEGGSYTIGGANAKAGQIAAEYFGRAGTDQAFAIRVHWENASLKVNFRHRATPRHWSWLHLNIGPRGDWELFRVEADKNGATLGPRKQSRLAVSVRPNEELAAGRWVSLVGRATERQYDVWANGKLIASGPVGERIDDAIVEPVGVQVVAGVAVAGRFRFALDYVAVWDLAGPRFPAGDAAPAKDAFPGRLVMYDTFDDAKTSEAFQGLRDGVEFKIEGGAHTGTWAGGKANQWLASVYAPPVVDVAFLTRLRAENAGLGVSFRMRTSGQQLQWLIFTLAPDGQWTLSRGERGKDGPAASAVLARSAAPDPTLAASQWVVIAGRAVGRDYEVWVNGKSLTRGTDPLAYDGPPRAHSLNLAAQAAKDGRTRFEADYAAVWDLRPASKP